jgi:hypothetical protein
MDLHGNQPGQARRVSRWQAIDGRWNVRTSSDHETKDILEGTHRGNGDKMTPNRICAGRMETVFVTGGKRPGGDTYYFIWRPAQIDTVLACIRRFANDSEFDLTDDDADKLCCGASSQLARLVAREAAQ